MKINPNKVKPSDFDLFEEYQSEYAQYFFAISLLTFGCFCFKQVSRIYKFDKLKEFVESGKLGD